MGKKYKVDMGGVDKEIRKGGASVRVPEGEYKVKILEATLEESEAGSKYFRWSVQIMEPKKYKGKKLRTNTSLKKDALWNLRNLIFAALGKNMAGKAFNLDPEQLYGKVVGVSVEDDEYKGKVRSQISTFFPAKEVNASEDDEDEDDEDETEVEDDEDEDLEEVEVEDL